MLAPLNSSFHVKVTPKRILIIASILCLLYITLSSEERRSWWNSQVNSRIRPRPQYSNTDGFDAHLNNSQWGERGIRVRKLIQWADELIQDPSKDRKSFEAALVQQFPFMAGAEKSIYTPWASSAVPIAHDVGIVICAGSKNFHLAAHLIRNLRRVHDSKVPIEIAYAGADDLRPEHREFLAKLDADISFIDLLEHFPAAHNDLLGSGWATKPFALLASSHTKAILVDADALFMTAPDQLFDTNPGLQRTGILFFHDRAAIGGGDERRFWVAAQIAAAHIAPSRYLATESLFYSGAAWYEADSGVVAIDKARAPLLLGLVFATWMNTKEIRDQVTYQIFYGDKESFWVAMELASVEYFFQPFYAGSMGTIRREDGQPEDLDLKTNEVEICGTHMLHLDHLGETPFWINGGVYEHKDNRQSGYARMSHYWVGETAEIRLTQPRWYWVNGNVGCLKEKGVKVIPDQILRNIQSIQEEARAVDEMIRHI